MFSIPIISLLDCLSSACIFFGAQDYLCHVGLSSASGKSFARSQENVAESSLINNKENIKYFSFSQVDTCFLFGYSLKKGATWNRLKPAETTQNHLKLPKTTQNNPETTCNHLKLPEIKFIIVLFTPKKLFSGWVCPTTPL